MQFINHLLQNGATLANGNSQHTHQWKAAITGATQKPMKCPIKSASIPIALKTLPRWINWRWEKRKNQKTRASKWTKPPVDPRNGQLADVASGKNRQWCMFSAALAKVSKVNADGVGFVLVAEDGFCGIDLDNCRNPETGKLEPWAEKHIKHLDSYAEVSPTGTGVKILLRAKKPPGACRTGNIEIYDSRRYFTITGQRLEIAPATVNRRQAQLDSLHAETFARTSLLAEKKTTPRRATNGQAAHQLKTKTTTTATSDDVTFLRQCMAKDAKLKRLWSGDLSEYDGDHSAADMALCMKLAFYLQRDRKRISAAFRKSGLMRDKWDDVHYASGATYGQHTIGQAVKRCTKVYNPPAHEHEDDPHRLARLFLEQHRLDAPGRPLTLRWWRGEFLLWRDGCYREFDERSLRMELTEAIKREFDRIASAKISESTKRKKTEARRVTTQLVSNALNALASVCRMPIGVVPPGPLGQPTGGVDNMIFGCSNILDLKAFFGGKTTYLLDASPNYFVRTALPFDLNLKRSKPAKSWIRFMNDLFGDDSESRNTLQEFMGYCLTTDTGQQKMLILVGPKRSGKSTISRVFRALVGPDNVCGPTLASLADRFGLQQLLDRTLAVVSDARLSGRIDSAVIVERLLSITGEDAVSVDRKFLPPMTVKLPSRLLVISNELPTLTDASGALAGRMVLIRLTRSFYGEEDVALTDKLLAELPGIFAWALDGLRRLRERGRFEQPAASRQVLREMEDLASPISAFLRERCKVAPNQSCPTQGLYDEYRRWREERGWSRHPTDAIFGRDLRSVIPELELKQPRSTTGRQRVYLGVGLKP